MDTQDLGRQHCESLIFKLTPISGLYTSNSANKHTLFGPRVFGK